MMRFLATASTIFNFPKFTRPVRQKRAHSSDAPNIKKRLHTVNKPTSVAGRAGANAARRAKLNPSTSPANKTHVACVVWTRCTRPFLLSDTPPNDPPTHLPPSSLSLFFAFSRDNAHAYHAQMYICGKHPAPTILNKLSRSNEGKAQSSVLRPPPRPHSNAILKFSHTLLATGSEQKRPAIIITGIYCCTAPPPPRFAFTRQRRDETQTRLVQPTDGGRTLDSTAVAQRAKKQTKQIF